MARGGDSTPHFTLDQRDRALKKNFDISARTRRALAQCIVLFPSLLDYSTRQTFSLQDAQVIYTVRSGVSVLKPWIFSTVWSIIRCRASLLAQAIWGVIIRLGSRALSSGLE